ncbi:MAG: hypothetical protein KAJ14_03790, partial [Candidatus Omnitrophica bacterium]|nr:hypothetical protein [Candidatus Omnitrophota bacterium]
MGLTKKDRENLKNYIINNVDKFPKAIATQTAKKFGISRQAVNRHIRQLKNNNILTCAGKGRSTQYALKETMQAFSLQVFPGMSEDQVWRDRVVPFLPPLKKNVLDICNHGFTEMLNNVIDHSEAKKVFISLEYNAKNVHFQINDSGVGIFNKIQKALKLEDPHHAILELAKGKFTTDP